MYRNGILVVTHNYRLRNWLSPHEVCVRILKGFHIIARGCGTPLPRVRVYKIRFTLKGLRKDGTPLV